MLPQKFSAATTCSGPPADDALPLCAAQTIPATSSRGNTSEIRSVFMRIGMIVILVSGGYH